MPVTSRSMSEAPLATVKLCQPAIFRVAAMVEVVSPVTKSWLPLLSNAK